MSAKQKRVKGKKAPKSDVLHFERDEKVWMASLCASSDQEPLIEFWVDQILLLFIS